MANYEHFNRKVLSILTICGGLMVTVPLRAYSEGNEYLMQSVQQKTKISGVVKDSNGEPVIGATILEVGTSNGVLTDLDGKFSLNVSSKAQIEISYIGFISQKVKAGSGQSLNIILREDTKLLDEVVVVGYGTMKKKNVTGSISSVDNKTLTVAAATNAVGAMQGKIAGVNIERNVGRPGGSFNIKIRGVNSINNSNSNPLYVINGIPTTEGLGDINPNDIESIDVLKDASATAIYGSRGANGVVIVTTKTGVEGRLSISYDAYVGVRKASNLPDMMNGKEYVDWRTELFKQMGRSTDRSNTEFFTADEWKVIDSDSYTDWQDLVMRNGLQYSNTVTASGGDEKGTFSASIGQLKEEGTVKAQDFSRYNMNLSLNRKFLSKWQMGGNMYFTYSIQNQGSYETLRSAYRLPPVAQAYDEEGNLKFDAYRNDGVKNPLFETSDTGEQREVRRYKFMGNMYLQVEPIKGLVLRSQISPQMVYYRTGIYEGPTTKYAGGKQNNTYASYETNSQFGYVLDNQIRYNKRINNHNFDFNFVQSLEYNRWENSMQEAKNFPYDSEWYNMDAVTKADIASSKTDFKKSTLASFLGRVQYSYKDRYMLTLTGRYDGSSRLAKGHKWAFFPSVAFAWRISEEDFMKDLAAISNLKLRLSYGTTGSDAVGIYGTQSNVAQYYYDFGGQTATSYYKNALANYDLTWEKTYETNIGVDFGVFNNRINGTVDVYRRDSKDLIMTRNLPATTGWSSIWDNIGKTRNQGIELSLNTVNIQTKAFTWNTNIVFDRNKNKIVELYGQKKDDMGNKWFIGKPINVNYDYEFDGIWQTSEAEDAAKYGQKPGQIRVKDVTKDGKITAEDKQVLGQRYPKWSGSITNSFQYKDFDLSFNVYTRQGAQMASTFVSSFISLKGNYNQLDVNYWTPDNPSNEYPQPGNEGKYFSSLTYKDVSFVRVGYITLGYSLPQSLLSKLKLKKLRMYFTTNNPFTFTSYMGYDPEWANQNTWGESTGYTTYLMGVNLEF